MGNKHMKRSSTSFTTMEMKIKTIVGHHYIPIRMAIKTLTIPSADKDAHTDDGKVKL